MRFAQPEFIYYGFLAAMSLGLFFVLAYKSSLRSLRKVASFDLLKYLLVERQHKRGNLKKLFFGLGVIFCIFSLSMPQWGFHWQELRRKGLDILIALDTSKSMLAEDMKPSRLERSKLAIGDFVKHLNGDRIGLIAFSGEAFLQCPLTVDYNGFLLALEGIDTRIIPKGGTSISAALREAIKGHEGGLKKHKILVLITDGEDHSPDLPKAIEEAKKEALSVFCIGIGTREGDLIPFEGNDGQKQFLKDKYGNVIKSRLDEDALQKIALATGGGYVRATNIEFGLELLYKQRFSQMEKRELEGKLSRRYEHRFQIPLMIGLFFLLLESAVGPSRKKIERI